VPNAVFSNTGVVYLVESIASKIGYSWFNDWKVKGIPRRTRVRKNIECIF
jgi:hypothetical protein